MDEHLGKYILHLAKPFRTETLVPRQCFIFASGPLLKLSIEIPEELVHRRPIERPIVIPPPSYRRVVLLRQFGNSTDSVSFLLLLECMTI